MSKIDELIAKHCPKGVKYEREVIDITELNARIEGIVSRQHDLRTQIDAIVADLEGV